MLSLISRHRKATAVVPPLHEVDTQHIPSLSCVQQVPVRTGQSHPCFRVQGIRSPLALSRLERQVYSLIDGKRDITRIAELLHHPETTVRSVLVKLKQQGGYAHIKYV